MRISPVMYSGYPCRKTIASTNINIGPTIQLINRETARTFVLLKTTLSFSYLTFVNGGYIINIKPIANGILVVPDENELINVDADGKKYQ